VLRICIAAAVLAASPAAADTERLWAVGGFGFGGGTERVGHINGSLFLDAHVWARDHVGVFASVLGYGASENEAAGPHTNGGMVVAGVSLRRAWLARPKGASPDAWAVPVRMFASLGVGVGQYDGTEWIDGGGNAMRSFDQLEAAWSARAGVAVMLGPVFVGTQLVGYGYARHGFAIQPLALAIGAGF
jgi:hypothetical protein